MRQGLLRASPAGRAPAGTARPMMLRPHAARVAAPQAAAAAAAAARAAASRAGPLARAATPAPLSPAAAPPPFPPHASAPSASARGRRRPPPAGRAAPPSNTAAAAASSSGQASLNSSSNSNGNPLAFLGRELGVQSASLDPRLREAVEAAIERAPGMRLTVGDAASSAGVTVAEADACLRALAYDCLAALEVSASGDVAYSFPRDFRAALARKSVRVRAVPLLRRAEEVAAFLVRAAFGAALVASAAIVWTAVFVLSSSSQRDDRRGGGGGFGGGRGGGGLYLWVDPLDWLLFWDPRYARRQRARADRGDRLSFLEAVFSFVFGDGDPNEGFSRRRWRALAAHVRRLGGVVTAEELAPFLDPPRLPRDARTGRVIADEERAENGGGGGGARYGGDESFVLPALLRLNGEAFVDEETGRLMYRFSDLQVTAADGGGGGAEAGGNGGLFGGGGGWFGGRNGSNNGEDSRTVKVPLERQWDFSAASPGQQAAALALGVANMVGVVILGGMLQDPIARLALVREGLGFVLSALPWLQAYAFAFFAVPVVRALVDARRNASIVARNAARQDAVELLRAPDGAAPALAAKRLAARRLGGRRVVGGGGADGAIIYDTESETDSQRNAVEEREFDEALAKKKSGDGGGGRGGGGGGGGSARGARAPPAVPAGRRFEDVFERPGEGQKVRRGGSQRRDDWDRLDRW